MKIKELAIALILSTLGGAYAFHEARINGLESKVQSLSSVISTVDGKLDALLQFNGVEYRPRK